MEIESIRNMRQLIFTVVSFLCLMVPQFCQASCSRLTGADLIRCQEAEATMLRQAQAEFAKSSVSAPSIIKKKSRRFGRGETEFLRRS